MPTGSGAVVDGVYKYGEQDPTGPLFSDFLNKSGDSIRTKLLEGRIEDTGWITAVLASGWTATNPVQYRRLNGVTYLKGRATGGSGTAFTLPAGFLPLVGFTVAAPVNGAAYGYVQVGANGAIAPQTQAFLNGLSWIAEQ